MGRTRTVTTLLAAGALALATVGPAAADPASDVQPLQVAYVLQAEPDYLVLNGPPFEQGCSGEGFVTPDAHVVDTPSDLQNVQFRYEDRVAVYDLDALGFADFGELITAACTALATGGEVPEPLAVGRGDVNISYRCEVGPNGTGERGCFEIVGNRFTVRVTIRGLVTDEDGTDYRVLGRLVGDRALTDEGPVERNRMVHTELHELGG